jgi:hypothetical protein
VSSAPSDQAVDSSHFQIFLHFGNSEISELVSFFLESSYYCSILSKPATGDLLATLKNSASRLLILDLNSKEHTSLLEEAASRRFPIVAFAKEEASPPLT